MLAQVMTLNLSVEDDCYAWHGGFKMEKIFLLYIEK